MTVVCHRTLHIVSLYHILLLLWEFLQNSWKFKYSITFLRHSYRRVGILEFASHIFWKQEIFFHFDRCATLPVLPKNRSPAWSLLFSSTKLSRNCSISWTITEFTQASIHTIRQITRVNVYQTTSTPPYLLPVRAHLHWAKAKFFFDLCRCLLWATKWIS